MMMCGVGYQEGRTIFYDKDCFFFMHEQALMLEHVDDDDDGKSLLCGKFA